MQRNKQQLKIRKSRADNLTINLFYRKDQNNRYRVKWEDKCLCLDRCLYISQDRIEHNILKDRFIIKNET